MSTTTKWLQKIGAVVRYRARQSGLGWPYNS